MSPVTLLRLHNLIIIKTKTSGYWVATSYQYLILIADLIFS